MCRFAFAHHFSLLCAQKLRILFSLFQSLFTKFFFRAIVPELTIGLIFRPSRIRVSHPPPDPQCNQCTYRRLATVAGPPLADVSLGALFFENKGSLYLPEFRSFVTDRSCYRARIGDQRFSVFGSFRPPFAPQTVLTDCQSITERFSASCDFKLFKCVSVFQRETCRRRQPLCVCVCAFPRASRSSSLAQPHSLRRTIERLTLN